MAELDNLLGSRISLISQQDVRYEGILFSINQSESSIVLQNVVCYGTEDRDAEKSVGASETVLAFVSFPGNEIKDLYVHEPGQDSVDKTGESQNLPNPPKTDVSPPAPPSQNKVRHENQKSQQRSDRVENRGRGKASGRGGGGRGAPSAAAGTGEHLLRLRERIGQNGQASVPAPVKPEGDFDFQSGLTSFKKAEVLAEVAEEQTKGGRTLESCYNKDNFFDTLSCAALDGEGSGGRQNRLTPSEERSLNQDTFGAIALQQSSYRRGGYRGGRGGGRGGQGHNRGGYHGGGNNYQRHHQGGYNRRGRGGYSQYGGRGGNQTTKPSEQSA